MTASVMFGDSYCRFEMTNVSDGNLNDSEWTYIYIMNDYLYTYRGGHSFVEDEEPSSLNLGIHAGNVINKCCHLLWKKTLIDYF